MRPARLLGTARALVVVALLGVSGPAAQAQGGFGFGDALRQGGGIVGRLLENPQVLSGNVSEESERNMGRAAAAVLLGAAATVDEPTVQKYVNTVGQWLAVHTERPNLAWRFAVLADDTVNAFAAPGGYILVSRGLFLALRNEHELAGVLAHEMAHVLRRHHVNALVAKERMNLALDLGREAFDDAGPLADVLVGAARNLYASGLDKSDEFEADRMGVVIAARAGYDAYGLVHTLMTLESATGDAALLGFFRATHPPMDERLRRLRAQLAQKRLVGRRPPAESELRTMQRRLQRPGR